MKIYRFFVFQNFPTKLLLHGSIYQYQVGRVLSEYVPALDTGKSILKPKFLAHLIFFANDANSKWIPFLKIFMHDRSPNLMSP